MVAVQRYPVQLDWDNTGGAGQINLKWQRAAPTRAASLRSQAGQGVDCYFVYRPKLDSVIAGYRQPDDLERRAYSGERLTSTRSWPAGIARHDRAG